MLVRAVAVTVPRLYAVPLSMLCSAVRLVATAQFRCANSETIDMYMPAVGIPSFLAAAPTHSGPSYYFATITAAPVSGRGTWRLGLGKWGRVLMLRWTRVGRGGRRGSAALHRCLERRHEGPGHACWEGACPHTLVLDLTYPSPPTDDAERGGFLVVYVTREAVPSEGA